MKRFLSIAAIAAALLVVVVMIAKPGRGDSAKTKSVTAGKANTAAAKAKPAVVNPIPPPSTVKVSGSHTKPVPILMYHVTQSAPAGTPYPELWVTQSDFKGQMNWLADHGYTGITMTELFRYWDDGYSLPKKPVVISFDDGNSSHYSVARPVLASHKWPGVLFLETNNAGPPKTGFTPTMVRTMAATGWEIDSHTVTHPDLTTIGAAQLKSELTTSRKRIRRFYHQPANFFCYPAGKYDDAVIAAVKAAHYKGATTVNMGVGKPSQPYELARIRVDGTDGVAGFASKMQQFGG